MIAFFYIYKVCDVNRYLPTSGIQKPGDNLLKFPGFYQISLDKSIQSSICYKKLGCKNGVLYQVKMEEC